MRSMEEVESTTLKGARGGTRQGGAAEFQCRRASARRTAASGCWSEDKNGGGHTRSRLGFLESQFSVGVARAHDLGRHRHLSGR